MQVELKCGTVIQIDHDYLAEFNRHSWRLDRYGYVRRTTTRVINGKRTNGITILLHRQIMCSGNEPREVDHINRDKLDNRRNNLRLVTRKANAENRDYSHMVFIRTGQKKSVFVHMARVIRKYKNRFYASMLVSGKQHSLGTYYSRDEAIARCVAERASLLESWKAR